MQDTPEATGDPGGVASVGSPEEESPTEVGEPALEQGERGKEREPLPTVSAPKREEMKQEKPAAAQTSTLQKMTGELPPNAPGIERGRKRGP
jgi:hypothetical protein